MTVSKTLTSWQEDDTMLRNSDTVYSCSCLFLTLFNSFLFLDSMSMTYGKWPTKYYNITITEHIMTNASFITTHLTLSRRFISTKESSVFFQELSSPSRMNNYKQIPLSSSQPSELVCGGRKTGKKSNLSLFYSISSP